MKLSNSLGLSHEYARKFVTKGSRAVDATAGHGRDTLLLSELVGESGKVWAFDIQDEAIESTKKLLEENNISNVEIIKDSHTRMADYVEPGLSCIMFNLGYLPGGDHSIQTQPESTIKAMESSLELLKPGGAVILVIYHGGDSGTNEREAVLEFSKSLPQNLYTVQKTSFINQKGNPPILLIIQKN